jgi:hypothetical protein
MRHAFDAALFESQVENLRDFLDMAIVYMGLMMALHGAATDVSGDLFRG